MNRCRESGPVSAFIRPQGRRPFIYGHRGARAHVPENTIAAFERALQDGADGVELDVRMSRDGGLFITHDDHIAFEGHDNALSLSQLTTSQVESLTPRSGLPLPTLRDALHFQSRTGALFNIELKGDVFAPLWMTEAAAEQIERHGGDRVMMSSFDPRVVRAFSKRLPQVPSALLFDQDQWLIKKLLPLASSGAVALHPQNVTVDAALIKRARCKAAVINVWTVNDASEAMRLSDLGVDGIIGDDPAMLIAALRHA